MQKRSYFSDTRHYQRLTKSFLASLFVLSGWPFAQRALVAARAFYSNTDTPGLKGLTSCTTRSTTARVGGGNSCAEETNGPADLTAWLAQNLDIFVKPL